MQRLTEKDNKGKKKEKKKEKRQDRNQKYLYKEINHN